MQSLVHRIRKSMLFVSGVAVVSMFGVWVAQTTWQQYQRQSQVQIEIMEQHRQGLVTGIRLAQNYIDSENKNLQKRAQNELRNQMDLAWSLMDNLLQQNPHLSPKEKVLRVAQLLRPLRFNQGHGYFFITGWDSVNVLYPPAPQKLEGKNVYVLDSATRAVVLAHDSIVRNHREGFHRYFWEKPGTSGGLYAKTSFVRGHDSLKIIVGTGLYDQEVLQGIQKDILSQLEKMQITQDAYFFAGTWDGVSLLGPAVGKNMFHVRDQNGIPVVQRLIALAKEGGGFLEYHMPITTSLKPTHKMSYVIGIPQWEWYVGIGRDIENFQKDLRFHSQLERSTWIQMIALSSTTLMAIVLLAIFLIHRFSQSFSKDIQAFMDYFRQAGKTLEPIPVESLHHTELRLIAQETNLLVDSLRRGQKEREAIQQSLEAKNQELEHILYIAGHDLRSPLLSIQGFISELHTDLTSLIETLTQSHPQHEALHDLAHHQIPVSLGYVKNGVAKMDNQLQGILRYSRAGRIQPNCEPIDMDFLVRQCLQNSAYMIQQAQSEIIHDPLPTCYGDPGLVSQILTNLIENAVKYRHGERPLRIRIHGYVHGAMATYVVEDNGIGIPADELQNIFQLFARTGQKKEASGEGLGLAISLRLALRMNGTLQVESAMEMGSRFSLTLPIRAVPIAL